MSESADEIRMLQPRMRRCCCSEACLFRVHAASSPVTRRASRLLALTAQRPGMVRGALWAEVEGVDWEDPGPLAPDALWRIQRIG